MKKTTLLFSLISTQLYPQNTYEQAFELQKNEQWKDAIRLYKNISHNDHYYLSALFNLGCTYLAIGKMGKAIEAFNKILAIQPDLIPVLYNRAYTYKTMGELDTAIALYKEIIALDNAYEPAHLALGFAYLINGDFENGWQQHQRYLKKSGKNGDRLRYLLEHNSIEGKIIVLHPEGGLGDSLHFIRYAQRLHEMGAHIIVCAQKPLIPLFSLCPYIDELISPDVPTPPFHANATLMSLPAIFNDTEKTFPNSIPYLQADPTFVEHWKNYLSNDTNYRIGICWQADVHNDVSRLPIARRGCLLKHFVELQNVLEKGISLYSLQKFDGVEEIAQMPSDFPLRCFEHLDEENGPFMDTAAIMKNMNLIITVDTAVAHLAGALGCDVWLLLPYATDWRWINKRTDSPWYPKMRIFKQQNPFDWQSVLQEVARELEKIK